MMGPPSGHLFYSRGMTVLKPPIGIPANSAGNAEISEQRRARWQAMAVPQRARRESADLCGSTCHDRTAGRSSREAAGCQTTHRQMAASMGG